MNNSQAYTGTDSPKNVNLMDYMFV